MLLLLFHIIYIFILLNEEEEDFFLYPPIKNHLPCHYTTTFPHPMLCSAQQEASVRNVGIFIVFYSILCAYYLSWTMGSLASLSVCLLWRVIIFYFYYCLVNNALVMMFDVVLLLWCAREKKHFLHFKSILPRVLYCVVLFVFFY